MMTNALRAGMLSLVVVASATCASSSGASAHGPEGRFILSCENGAVYPVYARGATDVGDMITGTIAFSPRKHASFRLVPMGTGYRYAGYGFWIDGIRNQTLLHVGRSAPIGCQLSLA